MGWPEHLTVAVNLSPAQFRDGNLAEIVADVLHATSLPAERLELQITETLLIGNTDEVVNKLNRLRELGVRIAMDDFGTGYSSLSYLARFPFSKIKIDRRFVRNTTREQAQMLRKFGCSKAQGSLYGHPETAPIHAERTRAASAKVAPIRRCSSAA